jgi:hypothetical protein
VDSTPFTAIRTADTVVLGEGFGFVRALFSLVASGADLEAVRDFCVAYPHALERGQLEGLERDPERPWLLAAPAPILASPDDFIDWDMPPVESDRVVRIMASKGCHFKCAFCATTYRQPYGINPNSQTILRQMRGLRAGGKRVQLLSNDPADLPYFHDLAGRMDSESFTLAELRDPLNRAALIKSGIGIARFGVEGISARTRTAFGKSNTDEQVMEVLGDLSDHHINTHLFFIPGAPWETQRDWEDHKVFMEKLGRTVQFGVCRLKYTAFCPTPPAPLGRFVPTGEYEARFFDFLHWVQQNNASRHCLILRPRGAKTHARDVAEQLSVELPVAERLVNSTGTFDLAPTLDDARRLLWEVIEWPIKTETRWKIGEVYKRRMTE